MFLQCAVLAAAITVGAGCGSDSRFLEGGFIRPPHWVESSPEPGAFLDRVPDRVTVRFDFNLHLTKTLGQVFRNGIEISVTQQISDDRKTLTLDLQGATGDGTWRVDLDACWPDGSCHPGQFFFYVNVDPLPSGDVPGHDSADESSMGPDADDNGGHDSGPVAPGVGDFLRPAHFTDSFPIHGETFARAPAVVVVNYNFNLHATLTAATVSRDGTPVAVSHEVTDDNYTQRIDLQGATGDGVWEILLSACWPDGSCHDGRLAFRVDQSIESQYVDRTGMQQTTVTMKDEAFDPPRIIVSLGTTVIWVDDDLPEHFVNSDPHPTHNMLPALNSDALNDGDTYEFTFDRAGDWGYHCSSHTGMTGRILVLP
jgi:plastocyanin